MSGTIRRLLTLASGLLAAISLLLLTSSLLLNLTGARTAAAHSLLLGAIATLVAAGTILQGLRAGSAVRHQPPDCTTWADGEDFQPRKTTSNRGSWLPELALGVLVLLAAFYRVSHYPPTRADELMTLEYVANGVRFGQFGLFLDGPAPSPALAYLGTGPTVLAPLWVMFQLFGVGLGSARLVASFSILVLGTAMYGVGHTLAGRSAGRLAVLGLLAFPETWNTGRQVMGDGLAAALLLLAVMAFARAAAPDSPRPLAAGARAGVLIGLLLVTKISFAIPLFGLVGDWIRRFAEGTRAPVRPACLALVAALLIVAPWEMAKIRFASSIVVKAATTRWGRSYTTLGSPAAVWPKAKEALARPEIGLLLAATVMLAARPRGHGRTVALAMVGLLSLAWFLLFAIQLHRYLIVPSLVGILLAAVVGAPLLFARHSVGWTPVRAAALLLLVVWPLARATRELAACATFSPPLNPEAELLLAHVHPDEAVYATPLGGELGFVTARRVIPWALDRGPIPPGSYGLSAELPPGAEAMGLANGRTLYCSTGDAIAAIRDLRPED